jgi:hypothetical protein
LEPTPVGVLWVVFLSAAIAFPRRANPLSTSSCFIIIVEIEGPFRQLRLVAVIVERVCRGVSPEAIIRACWPMLVFLTNPVLQSRQL